MIHLVATYVRWCVERSFLVATRARCCATKVRVLLAATSFLSHFIAPVARQLCCLHSHVALNLLFVRSLARRYVHAVIRMGSLFIPATLETVLRVLSWWIKCAVVDILSCTTSHALEPTYAVVKSVERCFPVDNTHVARSVTPVSA